MPTSLSLAGGGMRLCSLASIVVAREHLRGRSEPSDSAVRKGALAACSQPTAPPGWSGADLDSIFMISTSCRHDRDLVFDIPHRGIWDPVLKVAIPVEGTVAVGARREVSP